MLTVVVEGASPSVPFELKIDGVLVPSDEARAPHPVDPGCHDVTASARGAAPVSKRVEVVVSQRLSVTLSLGAGVGDVAIDKPSRHLSPLVYAGFGLGGLGVVAGAITGGLSLSYAGSVEELCPGGACATQAKLDEAKPQNDKALVMANVSNVAFALGLVGVGVGVAGIFLSGGDAKGDRATSTRVIVGPAGVGLVGSFCIGSSNRTLFDKPRVRDQRRKRSATSTPAVSSAKAAKKKSSRIWPSPSFGALGALGALGDSIGFECFTPGEDAGRMRHGTGARSGRTPACWGAERRSSGSGAGGPLRPGAAGMPLLRSGKWRLGVARRDCARPLGGAAGQRRDAIRRSSRQMRDPLAAAPWQDRDAVGFSVRRVRVLGRARRKRRKRILVEDGVCRGLLVRRRRRHRGQRRVRQRCGRRRDLDGGGGRARQRRVSGRRNSRRGAASRARAATSGIRRGAGLPTRAARRRRVFRRVRGGLLAVRVACSGSAFASFVSGLPGSRLGSVGASEESAAGDGSAWVFGGSVGVRCAGVPVEGNVECSALAAACRAATCEANEPLRMKAIGRSRRCVGVSGGASSSSVPLGSALGMVCFFERAVAASAAFGSASTRIVAGSSSSSLWRRRVCLCGALEVRGGARGRRAYVDRGHLLGDPLELGGELARGQEAIVRLLRERLHDGCVERGGDGLGRDGATAGRGSRTRGRARDRAASCGDRRGHGRR